MKNIIIASLLIACHLSITKGNHIRSRIYNGHDAEEGQFPFMARTLLSHKDSNGLVSCGASLISEQWLVSAAHCAVGAEKVTVFLNLTKVSDDSNALILEVPEANIFRHPKYSPDKSPSPDIVLYKLQEPIKLSEHPNIKPIQIPDVGQDSVGRYDETLVTAIGWGQTETGEGSDTLKYTTVRVMATSECRQKFPPHTTEATICTDLLYKNSGPCFGDSGGPLIQESSEEPHLLGITSFVVGAPPCSDPNGSAVYAYAPYYLDWIQQTISSN